MSYTKLGIINLALGRIGVEPTSALYPIDTGRAAEQASIVWEYILDEILEARDWKFAKTRIKLDQRYETPQYGYDFAYALPHDFMRFPRRTKAAGNRVSSAPPSNNVISAALYDEVTWPFAIETIPLPSGLEKLTNGTFTGAATGWTLGADWGYATNVVSKVAGGVSTLSQVADSMVSVPVIGELYLVKFDITAIDYGSLVPMIGGSSGSPISTVDTHYQHIEAVDATGLIFTPTSEALTCTIDNVSVFKMTDRLCLLSDFDATEYDDQDYKAYITYIKRVTDITRFTPSFINCLAYRLAQELATPLTEGQGKHDTMMKLYMISLSEADGKNQALDYLENETGDTSWEDAGR